MLTRSVIQRAWLVALALAAFMAVATGCDGTSEPTSEGSLPDVPELVEVPDATGEDGQDAVDTLEAEGFTVSFFENDGRDPSGCTVENQDTTGEAEPESEVILTLDCRQVDWENQEGEDRELS